MSSLLLAGCQAEAAREGEDPLPASAPSASPAQDDATARDAPTVRLAFGGDVHFEGGLADVPGRRASTLGPLSRALRDADLAMVNLESAVTTRGAPADKGREDPGSRYWFRSPPAALDLLGRSGVDVVSVANNHGADYGLRGLRDTVAAGERAPVALVGVGRDHEEAYRPFRTTVKGVDVAVHAADASPRESADDTWAVAPGTGPGLASARDPSAPQLVEAVRDSARTADVVVVYLHWGRENDACSTPQQAALARSLIAAGADVLVGTHAHVPLGAGRLDGAYVSYGLGNFFWYHGLKAETGVLQLDVRGGEVVEDRWVPGRIPREGGAPVPLTGSAREEAVERWRGLRRCTDLAPGPGAAAVATDASTPEPSAEPSPEASGGSAARPLPAYSATVRRIDAALARRMRPSHDPATCPVALGDLRQLWLSYIGFDGRAHRGSMVVHADVAREVADVFGELYRARFPIQRMRLVSAYGGDDDRSMAANNTSGYNCRRVAGQTSWSDHAYGRAVDINPVQNPYVVGGEARPPAGRRFVDADRRPGATGRPGVVRRGDVVTRAFGRLGWTWGGAWTEPDYQHFSAP